MLLLAAISAALISFSTIAFCSFKILHDMLSDRDAMDMPVHTFIYSAFYTQYRDDPEVQQTCIWFFACTLTYDFLRAITIGAAQTNGVIQIICLFGTEAIYLALIVGFRPFKTKLLNYLQISISFFRLAVIILLIPLLHDCVHDIFRILALILQGIIIILLFTVIFIKLIALLGNSLCKKNRLV